MRILLSEEQIKKVLLELKDTDHVAERLVERCLHGKLPVVVRRTFPLGYGQYREQLDKVGNYTFTDKEKNELKDKIVKLFSYDYNKKSYGVILQKFDLANRLKNIEFYGEKSKQLALDNMYLRGGGLYFVDFDEEKFDKYNREKYGDSVAIIIRDNDAETIMWGKMEKFGKDFFRTDYAINKIDSMIQHGATKASVIPDRIKNILSVKDKLDTTPTVNDTVVNTKPEDVTKNNDDNDRGGNL